MRTVESEIEKMKLNLNNLLEEIYSWKGLLREKDEEIENLQKQLLFANKRNEILEELKSSLLHEVSEANNAVLKLQTSLSLLKEYEADRDALTEERNQLKELLETQTKLYETQVREKEKEVQIFKQELKEQLLQHLKQIGAEASLKHESHIKKLEEKEKYILALKEDIRNIKNEKDQDAFKIKLEYEEKIGKIKNHLSKAVPNSHSSKVDSIFRQKYLALRKEHEETTSALKERIQTLESQVETMGTHKSTPLSILLEKSNLQKKATAQDWHDGNASSPKRLKTNENNLSTVQEHKTDKIILEMNRPKKKKLFNLNFNYFVK